MKDRFKEFTERLLKCIENQDNETAHIDADAVLMDIACDVNLKLSQRVFLVVLYEKVGKWYS